MNAADVYNEIKELNLTYLMLAQQLIRADRETAQYRLGIGADMAEVIERLTPGQVLKMAGSNMVLCRFRFDDKLLVGLLSSHERDRGTAHSRSLLRLQASRLAKILEKKRPSATARANSSSLTWSPSSQVRSTRK